MSGHFCDCKSTQHHKYVDADRSRHLPFLAKHNGKCGNWDKEEEKSFNEFSPNGKNTLFLCRRCKDRAARDGAGGDCGYPGEEGPPNHSHLVEQYLRQKELEAALEEAREETVHQKK